MAYNGHIMVHPEGRYFEGTFMNLKNLPKGQHEGLTSICIYTFPSLKGESSATWPPRLVELKVWGCISEEFIDLETLPKSLRYLELLSTNVKGDVLPEGLEEFIYSTNSVVYRSAKTRRLILPSTLKKFECLHCDLEVLPDLPQSLVKLDCSFNRLTKLPTLPRGLKRLTVNDNPLTILPPLPETLETLGLDGTYIKELKLPRSLKNLVLPRHLDPFSMREFVRLKSLESCFVREFDNRYGFCTRQISLSLLFKTLMKRNIDDWMKGMKILKLSNAKRLVKALSR